MAAAAPRRGRLLIGGEWHAGARPPLDVRDKYTGEVIGAVECAGREQVDAAIAAAAASFARTPLDPQQRYVILQNTARLIDRHREELAALITAEGGLPISDARTEVSRAVQTCIVSAEEGKRLVGEMVPIEAAPGQAHRMAFSIRVPRGVVCAITAFNSPLNMICHKVAPALASGNAVVMKPSELAPLSGVRLFELLLEAGVPPGHLGLVHGAGADLGPWLVENPQVDFYTFTGSARAGAWIRERVGLRPLVLELGSISPTIVCEDADLARAAARCAASAFRRAGQVCTSTQRLFVHRSVEPEFRRRLTETAAALVVGDPRDPRTDVGPMISEREAARAESWVREAVAAGATMVHGGRREGAVLQPTILADVSPSMRVSCEEIFAPVVSIIPYDAFDAAIAQANDTPFGLAAGIFTRDLTRAMSAARRLSVGLLHVNDASSSRVDLMPFGGVKQSGQGREGPKYAMQEMTQERLITLNLA
ncbi:MAG TPA: aldehyde dehydrogenase family protein [Vicinamibacterales bacterium]|nr:aldehyde dehydrogenase family protein [Vicinamibacterales bacterium]